MVHPEGAHVAEAYLVLPLGRKRTTKRKMVGPAETGGAFQMQIWRKEAVWGGAATANGPGCVDGYSGLQRVALGTQRICSAIQWLSGSLKAGGGQRHSDW